MNHRQPPHASAGMRKALHCLSLLLLPTIACASNLNGPRRYGPPACPSHHPEPYLPSIGAPSLRFQAEATMASAPLPPLNPKEVMPPNSPDALISATNAESAVVPMTAVAPAEIASVENKSTSPAGSAGGKIRLPAPILPDDIRPAVRPEDFLPFFQFPTSGGAGNVKVIVPINAAAAPTPGTIPPSSATYIQTP